MRGEQHLTTPAQYRLVYEKGSSWSNDLLAMRALPNGLRFSRYGFSVSRRVGGAVVRNRMKRRLREIMRRMPLRPGWDIVFIARSPAAARPDPSASFSTTICFPCSSIPPSPRARLGTKPRCGVSSSGSGLRRRSTGRIRYCFPATGRAGRRASAPPPSQPLDRVADLPAFRSRP